MTPHDFLELLDYDLWATNRVLDAAAQVERAFTEEKCMGVGSTRDLLVHLGDAQMRWIQRLKGESPASSPLDRIQTVAETREHCLQANQIVRNYVSSLSTGDLERTFQYRSLDGTAHVGIVRQILLQLFAHGIHHRAEACELLSRAGSEPAPVDLIVYYRSSTKPPIAKKAEVQAPTE